MGTFRKTWKRETAWVLLGWMCGSISWVLVNDVKLGVTLVEACIFPITSFASIVFVGQIYQNVSAPRARHTPPPAPLTPGYPQFDPTGGDMPVYRG